MKNLFWMASYPKSGNTWLRAFIGGLLGQELIREDGTFPKFSSQCSDRAIFEQVFAGEIPPATEGTFAWRPAFQRALSARFGQRQHFVKTHCRYDMPDGQPLFAPDVSVRAVMIVRNPIDVAASLTNHFGVDLQSAISIINNADAIMAKSSSRNFPTPLGDWSTFHRSWLRQTAIPLTIMRYEDLHADPERHFGKLAAEVFRVTDKDRVAQAMAAARFETLQARENRHGFDEKPTPGTQFFWKGRPFHGLEIFDSQQRRKIWDAHGEVAGLLGYRYDGTEITMGEMAEQQA